MKEIEENIADTLISKQSDAFKKEITNLLTIKANRSNSAALFILEEKVVGKKADSTIATAVVDPSTGVETTGANEIRRVTLKYCT